MKGLEQIPQNKSLLSAYHRLNTSSHLPTDEIIQYAHWTRFDPRLGEILTNHLKNCWTRYNPVEWNEKLKDWCWPAVVGVLCESVRIQIEDSHQKQLFKLWSQLVMSNIKPAPYQQFFIGLYQPGGTMMRKEVNKPLKAYLKWGFLARDPMINKAAQLNRTLIPKKERMRLLEGLMQKSKKITVSDYIHELDQQISLRQAQRDLKNHPQLISHGYTRNQFYTPK